MRYPRLIAGPALALACASLVILSSGDINAQWIPGTPQFQPTFDVKLCNDLAPGFSGPAPLPGAGGACAPDTTPNGNPDVTTSFNIPYGQMSYDQGYLVTSLADFTVAADAAIPDGTAAGGVERTINLGIAANPCNSTLFPEYIWWESTTDNVTSEIVVSPEGTTDRFATMAVDGGDAYPGQADANSPIVTGYPDTLNRLFDPDGDGIDTDGDPATLGDQPVTPHARYAGLTQVPPPGYWQMLQAVVFAPGDLQVAFSTNITNFTHPFAKLISALGYTTVVVRNDPTAAIVSHDPLSDFCSPLASQAMLLGMVDTTGNGVGDTPRLISPASGSHFASVRTQSLRDADLDGIENDFDTCPYTANTAAEDPYVSPGPDTDMLDSVCDPAPGIKNDDQDGDNYLNSQDLCPTVSNPLPGGETDGENSVLHATASPDGGPQGDAIGDTCDASPTVGDGDYFNAIYVDSVCIEAGGVVDSDEDGWCTDTDPNDSVPNDVGGTFSNQMPDATDPDGDGTPSDEEWAIGTDPLNDCPLIRGHDAWKPDINRDRVVNIVDIVKVLPAPLGSFGCSATGPAVGCYSLRRDVSGPDGVINLGDVLWMFTPFWGQGCVGPVPLAPTPAPTPGPNVVDLVAIDMDPAGNDDSTVGTIEDCAELASVGDTMVFDLVVKGIDPADKIAGYQFDIDFDPDVINVIGVLAVDAPGSTPPDDVTIISRIESYPYFWGGNWTAPPEEPSTEGSLQTMVADGTWVPDPPANYESGEGVLARITMKAVGTGTSALVIPGPLGGIPVDGAPDAIIMAGDGPLAGDVIPIATLQSGEVVVGGTCAVAPTPTPTPTPGPGDCPDPGSVPWPVPVGDADCDGFSTADEGTIGTDPTDACADDETDDAWPSDFDMNTVINITDVFKVLPPHFGSSPPDPNYSVRRDLAPDGVINITDVFKVLPPFFGSSCTP